MIKNLLKLTIYGLMAVFLMPLVSMLNSQKDVSNEFTLRIGPNIAGSSIAHADIPSGGNDNNSSYNGDGDCDGGGGGGGGDGGDC